MKCPVCLITWDDSKGAVCPQCKFDSSSPHARDTVKVLQAREAFKTKTSAYDPSAKIPRSEIIKPWLAVILGFGIFLLWLKACGSMLGGRFSRYSHRSYSQSQH
jgi:hypothetical protein